MTPTAATLAPWLLRTGSERVKVHRVVAPITPYEPCGVQVGDCWFVASAAVLGRERPFAAGLAVNDEQAADRLDGDCRLAWRSDAMAQTPSRARSDWRSVGF